MAQREVVEVVLLAVAVGLRVAVLRVPRVAVVAQVLVVLLLVAVVVLALG